MLQRLKDSNLPTEIEVDIYTDRNVVNRGLYYLHNDHLGTSSFVTDGDGDPTQFYLNFPFGETLYEQQNTNAYENPYKFNAKELDDETGLYYYGARYYDPRIGMWLSVDPLAEKFPAWSPYHYAYDNPLKYVDPDGRGIVPWFVNRIRYLRNGKGNFSRDGYNFKLFATRGYFSTTMDLAMKKFVQSETGRGFLLQYMKKGQTFYGITATQDGVLSHKTLNIYDIRNDNKVDRNYNWVMGYDGYIANGKMGFDHSTGDLNMYIGTAKINSNRVDDIVETIAHELGQHGIHHKEYLKLLESGDMKKLNEIQGKNFINDHYESKNQKGAKVYNGMMKDLKMDPKWKKE